VTSFVIMGLVEYCSTVDPKKWQYLIKDQVKAGDPKFEESNEGSWKRVLQKMHFYVDQTENDSSSVKEAKQIFADLLIGVPGKNNQRNIATFMRNDLAALIEKNKSTRLQHTGAFASLVSGLLVKLFGKYEIVITNKF